MNKIISKFLLTGDKFMPELPLKYLGFTHSACGPLTKHCQIIQTFRQKGNLKHLYWNEVDKSSFAHDPGYSDSEELAKNNYFR